MLLICVVASLGVFHWQEQRRQVVAHQESLLSDAWGPGSSLQKASESFFTQILTHLTLTEHIHVKPPS